MSLSSEAAGCYVEVAKLVHFVNYRIVELAPFLHSLDYSSFDDVCVYLMSLLYPWFNSQTQTHAHIHTHTHTGICTHTHTHTCTHKHVHIDTHMHMHTQTSQNKDCDVSGQLT